MTRMLLAGIVAVATTLPLAQPVHAGPTAPTVPGDIAVLEGHKPFLIGHATGVQIYACNATEAVYKWGLVAPRANLYDDDGKLIATDDRGPGRRPARGHRVHPADQHRGRHRPAPRGL